MSIITFEGNTAAKLYEEGLQQLRVSGIRERSRNGSVLTIPGPVIFTLTDPTRRVLDDKVRNANPYFHMMEFIWMVAGRLDVKWLLQFNKNMEKYADDGILNAAYGYRWREHYQGDQIAAIIEKLKADRTDRQCVIQMWDPDMDLWSNALDKACNTSIMFRVNAGALDMLVTNRSNDFVYGALGANIVHFTLLHELVSAFSGIPLGVYRVISNNLHVYPEMPNYNAIINTIVADEVYRDTEPFPLVHDIDSYATFVDDCESFCRGNFDPITSPWLRQVAMPAWFSWYHRKAIAKGDEHEFAFDIQASDWRNACLNYKERKILSSATSTEP